MEVFKKRLLEEYDQLTDRLTKLENFAHHNNDKFLSLSENMQDLMLNQYKFMSGYQYCLGRRINLLISEDEIKEYRAAQNI